MQCGLFLTAIWTIILYQNGVQLSKVLAARPPGYLDFDNLPETNFTCEGKVIGGYYADIETGCQMFHVCTIGQKGDMTDIKFLCLNGTVFDQETRVCERVDEVDCSKSKDFYDLNLELYNNGFGGILPEDESEPQNTKTEEEEVDIEEIYDENYDAETEETPLTSTKTSTTSTTTTTTTTTTPKPIIYSSIKPTFSIILPNLKNKNTGTHLTGLVHQPSQPMKQPQPQNVNVGSHLTGVTPMHQNYGTHVPSGPSSNQNKNIGTHLTGLIPNKNAQTTQTQRPYGYVTTPTYDPRPTLDTGLKPPPSQYKPYTSGVPSTSYKPPSVYDTYRSHFFSSSTPNPISSILLNNYNNHKQPGIEEIRPSEQSKGSVVVVSHHFPTINPSKNNYDTGSDFTSFSSPSAPGAQYTRHRNRPVNLNLKPIPSLQKYNPTILALQSQQKKVHQLHQEGLVRAEHEIAQVASRNAEISSLRSQKSDEITSRKDELLDPLHRETKEIHAENRSFSKPSIAIITSTSSTSSRIQKPGMTFTKTIRIGNSVFKPETEFKTELEKLFEVDKKEEKTDADLEQLLLAWKLKTNQEVTKSDIEKVFSSLDLSKFKNGEAISLSDIFNLIHSNNSDVTTRVPPASYDDYTEEDVPFDPFYKDVPKVQNSRTKRDSERIHNVPVKDNGRFTSREAHKRGKNQESEPVRIADIKVITERPRGGRTRVRTTETSAINDNLEVTTFRGRRRDRIKFDSSSISQYIRKNNNGTDEIVDVPTPMPYPKTGFTCKNKIAGGFYADTEVDCQLFHICSDAGNGSLVDHKFFCGEGTRFNQRSRTCQARDVVECELSTRYYHLNENFRIPPPEEAIPEPKFESTRIES